MAPKTEGNGTSNGTSNGIWHGSSNGNEIPAEIPSGVQRMGPYMLGGLFCMTTLYATLFFVFRNSSHIFGLSPAKEFCPPDRFGPDDICSRSDLFAFQMTTWLTMVFCGTQGIYAWHLSKRAHSGVPQTPQGRIFGYLPEAEQIAAACCTYQIWDFMISLLIPEHRTPIMMTHHVMAATVSWCSIRYQYLHHYGVFFLGLSEVSTIFLVFVDLCKFFPPIPGSLYDQTVGSISGPLFAVTFITYRIALWWPISLQLFRDARAVLQPGGQAAKLRPGKEWVLYVFLGTNIPLGLLQLYWFTIILEAAKGVLLQ